MTGDLDTGSLDTGIDAEAWLAKRGVPRQAITIDLTKQPDVEVPVTEPAAAATTQVPVEDVDEEAVAEALNAIRAMVAATPMATGRVERKLASKDFEPDVIAEAIGLASDEGLVGDAAFAAALVAEGRDKGHAIQRLRDDLRKRELPEDIIKQALKDSPTIDPDAEAFAAAQGRAPQLAHLEGEVAYRRLVAWLGRRGHSEHLAHKAARSVLWADREERTIAER